MTRDEILQMAAEAGFHSAVLLHFYRGRQEALCTSEIEELKSIERFANLIAAAEREACARIAEEPYEFASVEAHRIAADIRARSRK